MKDKQDSFDYSNSSNELKKYSSGSSFDSNKYKQQLQKNRLKDSYASESEEEAQYNKYHHNTRSDSSDEYSPQKQMNPYSKQRQELSNNKSESSDKKFYRNQIYQNDSLEQEVQYKVQDKSKKRIEFNLSQEQQEKEMPSIREKYNQFRSQNIDSFQTENSSRQMEQNTQEYMSIEQKIQQLELDLNNHLQKKNRLKIDYDSKVSSQQKSSPQYQNDVQDKHKDINKETESEDDDEVKPQQKYSNNNRLLIKNYEHYTNDAKNSERKQEQSTNRDELLNEVQKLREQNEYLMQRLEQLEENQMNVQKQTKLKGQVKDLAHLVSQDSLNMKLEKEMELLKTIDRIKQKIKKSIARKMQQQEIQDKTIKQNDKKPEPKKPLNNKKNSQQQQMSVYLLNKGLGTVNCTNH